VTELNLDVISARPLPSTILRNERYNNALKPILPCGPLRGPLTTGKTA
jgi:hypothetical protein